MNTQTILSTIAHVPSKFGEISSIHKFHVLANHFQLDEDLINEFAQRRTNAKDCIVTLRDLHDQIIR